MSGCVDDSGVEVFLDVSSSKQRPIILPSRAGMQISSAKRKWLLLKNLVKFENRLTSLTKVESEFLEKLGAENGDGTDLHKEEDDDLVVQARQELQEKMNRCSLTVEESDFLIELVNHPNANEEYLKKTTQVLYSDPLFTDGTIKESNEPPSSPSPPMRRHHDADSFRVQVWTHFGSGSSASLKPDSSERQAKQEEEKEETSSEKQQKKKKPSFMYKFFFKKNVTGDTTTDTVSNDEEPDTVIQFTILATSALDVDCHPHVLSPPIMDSMRPFLPYAVQQDNFWLKYSLVRDGASMHSLLQKVRSSARTILAIETMDGHVFGAFSSSPWRYNTEKNFFGSCEAFVWRLARNRNCPTDSIEDQIQLESHLQCYPWSGKNRNVQSLANAQLIIGGGGSDDASSNNNTGSGIVLTSDLSRGFSDPCTTFESPSLYLGRDGFEICNIEVWALTPVDSVQEAEKLELGRQFIFDHGNFLDD